MMIKINELRKFVNSLDSIELAENHNFKSDTTIRLASSSNLITVKSIKAGSELLKFLNLEKISYKILGWGANQVIPDDPSALWLKLELPFPKNYLDSAKQEYTFPASVRLSLLTRHATAFGIRGWEVFTGIPAQLGGAVFMNAGTRLGEIGDLVSRVKIIQLNGEIKDIEVSKSSFSYRENHFINEGELLVEVVMKGGSHDEKVSQEIRQYLTKRNETQPMNKFTCGCVFKNPIKDSAGRLIEVSGLKGFMENGVKVSHKHGNFFENHKNGTMDDFYFLSKAVREEIELQFGVTLDFEVKLNL